MTAVEAALRDFVDSRRPIVDDMGSEFGAAVTALETFVLRGGKRIRPSFAWTAWLGAGGDPSGPDAPAVLNCCAALELVQACALVHDDIIDASRTRRGNPTVHVAQAEWHAESGWRGDSERFGESIAILLGDLALAWADDMVTASGLAADAAARLAPVWSAMRTEVLGGQFLDLLGEARDDESVDSALRINRYKTAAYTVERPLHIGAVLADAPAGLVRAYRDYGTDLGIAFQLRDDLLGVFGDPAVTGKPSGDDLREGKRTVLYATALQLADRRDQPLAAELRAGIGTDLSDTEVQRFRDAFTDLGAVAEVEQRITELTGRAVDAVDASSATPAAKQRLRDMAASATARTS